MCFYQKTPTEVRHTALIEEILLSMNIFLGSYKMADLLKKKKIYMASVYLNFKRQIII